MTCRANLGCGLALLCGLAGVAPAHADSAAACATVAEVLEVVAERYEPMKKGGGDLMMSLARISMKSGPARAAAEGADWDGDIVGSLVKLQESPATDGQGGFKPTPESSPDYVLGLARALKEKTEDTCVGTDFVDLP